MDPDDSDADAAALRARVDALEQTVSEQQATIDALSSPPVSRRGVLAALTGVAGAGALGAYSQRASAQAAGQVGTSAEPVDVEAYNLNVQGTADGLVQNPLGGDLDAGGNDLTNVGAASVGNLSAATLEATNETLIKATTDALVTGNAAGSFVSPSYGTISKDERGEFANDQFIPDNDGWYFISAVGNCANTAVNGSRMVGKLRDVTNSNDVSAPFDFTKHIDFSMYPRVVGVYELTAGVSYEYQVSNSDDSFDVNSGGGEISIRSVFR